MNYGKRTAGQIRFGETTGIAVNSDKDPVADAMPSGVEAEPVNGGFYPMLIGENVNAGTFGGNVQPVVEKIIIINTRTIRMWRPGKRTGARTCQCVSINS